MAQYFPHTRPNGLNIRPNRPKMRGPVRAQTYVFLKYCVAVYGGKRIAHLPRLALMSMCIAYFKSFIQNKYTRADHS